MSTVIIVEEDQATGEGVAEMCRQLGYTAYLTTTGQAGLVAIKKSSPCTALVSSTVADLSAYEIARRLNYDYAVSVILMFGDDAEASDALLISHGVAEFVRKPINAFELEARLARATELGKMFRVRERLVKELERLSQTDDLTGLLNARVFFKRLDVACRLAAEEAKPLSLIMLDLDHFKRLNDEFGHSVGNDVLQLVGASLLSNIKPAHHAFRYGGEEFVVLMPDTELSQAAELAELLRVEIETMGKIHFAEAPVTASVGAVQLGEDEPSKSLSVRADKAMYDAKSGGRNRVVVAPLNEGG
jgi:two-component system, cell cycle response regulator